MLEGALLGEVRAALAGVHDPCSVAAGRPTSIADMGLVLDARLHDGVLVVTFGVTWAGCTMAPHFTEAARTVLMDLPGVERVKAMVDTAAQWVPPRRVAMRGTPQAWRERLNLRG
jgi:metal-sulfur cluster biosynthetic enzyme